MYCNVTGNSSKCPKFRVKNIRDILYTFDFKSLVFRLGVGMFKSWSRLDFLIEVSVSQRQCLESVSKILAKTQTRALQISYNANGLEKVGQTLEL